MSTLTIPARYCGPTGSGNGGYACGAIAAYADGPVTVKLRRPPPLEVAMTVEQGGEGLLRVRYDGTLIAETAPSAAPLAEQHVPGPISMDEVRAVTGRARYFEDPYFPDCFVCGTNREPGDGLRIFPGPMLDRPMWAAPWTPDRSVAGPQSAGPESVGPGTAGPESAGPGSAGPERVGPESAVRPEVVWAALDCPSGIAAGEGTDLGQDTAIVLGQMTASLSALPAPGDQCQVIAWPAGRDGRKLTAGSALLGPGGDVLAIAATIWITVPRPAIREELTASRRSATRCRGLIRERSGHVSHTSSNRSR
jgi:hypothetical protein